MERSPICDGVVSLSAIITRRLACWQLLDMIARL